MEPTGPCDNQASPTKCVTISSTTSVAQQCGGQDRQSPGEPRVHGPEFRAKKFKNKLLVSQITQTDILLSSAQYLRCMVVLCTSVRHLLCVCVVDTAGVRWSLEVVVVSQACRRRRDDRCRRRHDHRRSSCRRLVLPRQHRQDRSGITADGTKVC